MDEPVFLLEVKAAVSSVLSGLLFCALMRFLTSEAERCTSREISLPSPCAVAIFKVE